MLALGPKKVEPTGSRINIEIYAAPNECLRFFCHRPIAKVLVGRYYPSFTFMEVWEYGNIQY